MRAVVCHQAELSVEDLPEPEPAAGQARITVDRAGICGSDLHARHGVDSWAEIADSVGYHRFARSTDRIVFGHEYVGTVAEYGPKTQPTLAPGTPVVAVPLIRNAGDHVDSIGLSPHAPGAYAEQMLVQASLMLAVPNGLDLDVAALTEPLAVAHHAVRRSEIGRRQAAIVIGSGPIGLAVILMLKARGVQTVIASDLSAARRDLAVQCGADVVVDPATDSPYAPPDTKLRALRDAPAAFNLAIQAVEQASRLPLIDWRHVHRVAERLGAGPSGPVVFECVGVPGMIDSVITDAPLYSRVVVVGVCVGEDRFMPARAIQKEIDLRFVFGYTPLEFRDTLHLLADGQVDPRPLLTGTVGLEGVEDAFAALGQADRHAKILIDPASAGALPR